MKVKVKRLAIEQNAVDDPHTYPCCYHHNTTNLTCLCFFKIYSRIKNNQNSPKALTQTPHINWCPI